MRGFSALAIPRPSFARSRMVSEGISIRTVDGEACKMLAKLADLPSTFLLTSSHHDRNRYPGSS